MASSNASPGMARRPVRLLPMLLPGLLVASSAGLAGCNGQSVSNTLGLTRDAPNEFTVTTRAPLQMPPAFDLRPPEPGAPRPQEQSERRQAEEALVPDTALSAGSGQSSPGQAAILQASGPPAPPDIRQKVNQETALDKPRQTLTDRLQFWQPPPPAGTVVDPAKEAQRLRENAALGQSVATGDTPIVQPKRRSILGSLDPF